MQANDWKSISKIRLERAVEFYGGAVALYKEDLDDMIPKVDKLITEVHEYLEPKISDENNGN